MAVCTPKHTACLSKNLFIVFWPSRPPIDSILTLVTVWRIREKIIRTAIVVSYICTLRIGSSYNFRLRLFSGFVFRKG